MSVKDEIKQGELIQETLRILGQRWVSSSDIEAIPNRVGLQGDDVISVKIFVVNQLLEIYRSVSDRYFKEQDHRESLMETVQEALDDLIEEEENSYDEEGEEGEEGADLNFDF